MLNCFPLSTIAIPSSTFRKIPIGCTDIYSSIPRSPRLMSRHCNTADRRSRGLYERPHVFAKNTSASRYRILVESSPHQILWLTEAFLAKMREYCLGQEAPAVNCVAGNAAGCRSRKALTDCLLVARLEVQ